jgi:hypothetical protein
MVSRRRAAAAALRMVTSGRADAVAGGRATAEESRAAAKGVTPDAGRGGGGPSCSVWRCTDTVSGGGGPGLSAQTRPLIEEGQVAAGYCAQRMAAVARRGAAAAHRQPGTGDGGRLEGRGADAAEGCARGSSWRR